MSGGLEIKDWELATMKKFSAITALTYLFASFLFIPDTFAVDECPDDNIEVQCSFDGVNFTHHSCVLLNGGPGPKTVEFKLSARTMALFGDSNSPEFIGWTPQCQVWAPSSSTPYARSCYYDLYPGTTLATEARIDWYGTECKLSGSAIRIDHGYCGGQPCDHEP